MANRGWFDEIVPVVLASRSNVVHRVSNAMQAGEMLVDRWPAQGTAKHLAARRACAAVIKGQLEAAAAGKAFAKAAAEANVLESGLSPADLT